MIRTAIPTDATALTVSELERNCTHRKWDLDHYYVLN